MKLFSFKNTDKYKRVLTLFGVDFSWTNTREMRKRLIIAERQLKGINLMMQFLYDITKAPKAKGEFRELQIMKAKGLELFSIIADKYNLIYWLDFGTLLGAIRHKGFIPWDDDIDVSMPREEYNKLYDIFKKELEQYPDIKIEIVHKGILILRFMYKDAALFDIFPYDSYHKETLSEKEKANLFKESKKCFKKIRQNWLNNKTKDNLPLFLDNIRLNVDKHILNNNKRTGDIFFVGCEGLGDKMFFFKKQDIFPLKKALFEEVEFNVPANYHKILSEIYGDYMSLPDISKFQINHMGAFNTNNDNVYQDKNLGEITALMTDIIKKIKENQA